MKVYIICWTSDIRHTISLRSCKRFSNRDILPERLGVSASFCCSPRRRNLHFTFEWISSSPRERRIPAFRERMNEHWRKRQISFSIRSLRYHCKGFSGRIITVYERARKYRVPKVRTGDLRFIDSNLTLLMGRLVRSIKSRKFGWIKSFVSLIQICRSLVGNNEIRSNRIREDQVDQELFGD